MEDACSGGHLQRRTSAVEDACSGGHIPAEDFFGGGRSGGGDFQ